MRRLRAAALSVQLTSALLPSAVLAQATLPAPTTAAAATVPGQAAADVAVVARGGLDLVTDVAAVFEPVEPVEVRPVVRRFEGPMTVVRAAAAGATVAAGDVLLELDATPARHQLAGAENELAVARATLAKAEADARLGARADELAMDAARRQATVGRTLLEWWDKLDASQVVAVDEINRKIAAFQAESQADELAELRKMYAADDLTNETTDIVLKRANRTLELFQDMLGYQTRSMERTTGLETKLTREGLSAAVPAHEHAVEQLAATHQHAAAQRASAVTAAALAVEVAQRKVDDLTADVAAFTVRATGPGVVAHGAITVAKAWQPTEPRALRPGERVQLGQVLMTVYAPGRMAARLEVPESKLAWVRPGEPVKLRPTMLPDAGYEGTLGTPSPVGQPKGEEQVFDVPATVAGPVDPRLPPLSRATVTIDAGRADNVLLVPATAVAKGGRVHVREADGTTVRRVTTGRSNGEQTEVLAGVSEGERVLVRPPQ